MNKPYIVLADDNENDIKLTTATLKRVSLVLDVKTLPDGVELLEFLHRRGAYAGGPEHQPAIILLDIKMPKLNGLEVLERIKGNPAFKSIVVVMFTSSVVESDIESAYQLGANGYVVKPVDFQKFHEIIGKLIDYWLTVNSLPSGVGLVSPLAM